MKDVTPTKINRTKWAIRKGLDTGLRTYDRSISQVSVALAKAKAQRFFKDPGSTSPSNPTK